MSAHSRPLELVCYQNGCRKQATEEVFNTYNASQGKFCKAHAAQRVAALRSGEKTMFDLQQIHEP